MLGHGLVRTGLRTWSLCLLLALGLAVTVAPAQEGRAPLKMYYVPFAAQNLGEVGINDLPKKVRPFFEFNREEDIAWLQTMLEKNEVKGKFTFSVSAIRIRIEHGTTIWCVDSDGNVLKNDLRFFKLNPIEATRTIESRKSYLDFLAGK